MNRYHVELAGPKRQHAVVLQRLDKFFRRRGKSDIVTERGRVVTLRNGTTVKFANGTPRKDPPEERHRLSGRFYGGNRLFLKMMPIVEMDVDSTEEYIERAVMAVRKFERNRGLVLDINITVFE